MRSKPDPDCLCARSNCRHPRSEHILNTSQGKGCMHLNGLYWRWKLKEGWYCTCPAFIKPKEV